MNLNASPYILKTSYFVLVSQGCCVTLKTENMSVKWLLKKYGFAPNQLYSFFSVYILTQCFTRKTIEERITQLSLTQAGTKGVENALKDMNQVRSNYKVTLMTFFWHSCFKNCCTVFAMVKHVCSVCRDIFSRANLTWALNESSLQFYSHSTTNSSFPSFIAFWTVEICAKLPPNWHIFQNF